jgi:hypothetical protein
MSSNHCRIDREVIIADIKRVLIAASETNDRRYLQAKDIFSQLSLPNQTVLQKAYGNIRKGFSAGAWIGRELNEMPGIETKSDKGRFKLYAIRRRHHSLMIN